MIVYKITNLENGKIYVGQTRRTLEERFKEHCQADSAIGRAIRKYGKKIFKREILETCETIEELNEREKFWIKYFDCMSPKGYNKTDGGESTIIADDVREQISETLKKYYEEHPEALEKISEDQKKRFEDPEERAKAAERTRKSFEDPERSAKQSECQKKRFENPEEREKISAVVTERFSDPEERQKQSERLIKYFEDPAAREKCSEAQKKRFESEESRIEYSEKMKKYYAENPVPEEIKEKRIAALREYWARKREEKKLNEEVGQLTLNFSGV